MDDFRVSFIPTENCNLRCYYCSRNCQTPVDDSCSTLSFKRVIDFIVAQERPLKSFEFFGGEPTTSPYFLDMVEMVFKYVDTDVSALTNLIKPLGYYLGFPSGMKFSCSYHSHGMDGKAWMRKVSALHTAGMIRDVKMIMTPDNEEYIAGLFDMYKENDFEVYEIVLMEQMEGTEWAESAHKKYHGSDYIGEYRPRENYKGMMCCAGFQIAPNGDLFRCRSAYNTGKPITNLFTGQIKKLEKWHICPYEKCDVNDIEFDKMTIKEYVAKR